MTTEGGPEERYEKVYSPDQADTIARMLGFPKCPVVVRLYVNHSTYGKERKVVYQQGELLGVIEELIAQSPVHMVGLKKWPEMP